MKIERINLLINTSDVSKNPPINLDLSDKKALARDLFEFSQKSSAALMENILKTPKKEKKPMDGDTKAFAVAARIMAGDKVPLKDEKFLKEHDAMLYARAKMFAIKKAKVKKHKSVLEDEKGDNSNESGEENAQNSDADSPSVDISYAASAD